MIHEGFVYGGMQVKKLSWWDRLVGRKCSFCERPLKGMMLYGYDMDRPGGSTWSCWGGLRACINVEECENFIEASNEAAEDAEKKKLEEALEEQRKNK